MPLDPMLSSLVREALLVALLASAPPLAAALATGLLVGVLQAATQVQDPAVGVAPRLVAVLGALAAAGPWIGAHVLRFASACLELAARGTP
jgi:type III secretory pathway component EscS